MLAFFFNLCYHIKALVWAHMNLTIRIGGAVYGEV